MKWDCRLSTNICNRITFPKSWKQYQDLNRFEYALNSCQGDLDSFYHNLINNLLIQIKKILLHTATSVYQPYRNPIWTTADFLGRTVTEILFLWCVCVPLQSLFWHSNNRGPEKKWKYVQKEDEQWGTNINMWKLWDGKIGRGCRALLGHS